MYTILGSNGIIGKETADQLNRSNIPVRLVSRNPRQYHSGDEYKSADLLDGKAVNDAVKGSEVTYLTAGIKYNSRVWEKEWPVIMQNVINACLNHGSRFVFFDNVYMYDPEAFSSLTEESPIRPVSKKGAVRAGLIDMIKKAEKDHGLRWAIVRSADFYGPDNTNSFLIETVFKPLSKGKKANWLGDPDKLHSFTYTPDAGKLTALVGRTPDAFGQTWHVPTAPPLKGSEWVRRIASELNTRPGFNRMSKGMVRILGWFIPVLGESVEMMYQFERDYVFNGKKAEDRFNIQPTPVDEAIREIVQSNFKNE